MDLLTEKMGGLLISTLSGQLLGEVSPSAHRDVALSLLPLKPGIQRVTGVRVTDIETGQHSEEEIGEILVYKE